MQNAKHRLSENENCANVTRPFAALRNMHQGSN